MKGDGMFYMVEFHPVVSMFDENYEKIKYSYFNFEPIIEETKGSYTDRNADFKHTTVEWSHSLAEVFTSLLKQKLRIIEFDEFPVSVYNCFNKTVKTKHGYWEIEGFEDKIPMMFAVKAIKNQ